MPHVICEYSANLEKKIRIDALLETLHAAMMRTGAAELGGLRTRADRRDQYRIADNDPAAREHFRAEVAEGLRTAFPAHDYGTVLPFTRVFVVAYRR